jgi:hypothetical protein
MHRITAIVLGIVVALLAIAGLFVEGSHLFGIMNVDITLDVLRVVIAIALLVVGFARVRDAAVRAVLIIVGVLYVLMALLAFASTTLFGILPTGLTGFDIGFHLVVGIAAIVIALLRDRGWRADRGVAGSGSTARRA